MCSMVLLMGDLEEGREQRSEAITATGCEFDAKCQWQQEGGVDSFFSFFFASFGDFLASLLFSMSSVSNNFTSGFLQKFGPAGLLEQVMLCL